MSNLSLSLSLSERMSSGEDCADDRGGGTGALHQIQRDLPQPTHPAGAGGSAQNLWYVHTNTHTHTGTHAHTHRHAHTQARTHAHTHSHMQAQTHTHTQTHKHI